MNKFAEWSNAAAARLLNNNSLMRKYGSRGARRIVIITAGPALQHGFDDGWKRPLPAASVDDVSRAMMWRQAMLAADSHSNP
jgi:hypothetical protein